VEIEARATLAVPRPGCGKAVVRGGIGGSAATRAPGAAARARSAPRAASSGPAASSPSSAPRRPDVLGRAAAAHRDREHSRHGPEGSQLHQGGVRSKPRAPRAARIHEQSRLALRGMAHPPDSRIRVQLL
jgi:hypothetical protein